MLHSIQAKEFYLFPDLLPVCEGSMFNSVATDGLVAKRRRVWGEPEPAPNNGIIRIWTEAFHEVAFT